MLGTLLCSGCHYARHTPHLFTVPRARSGAESFRTARPAAAKRRPAACRRYARRAGLRERGAGSVLRRPSTGVAGCLPATPCRLCAPGCVLTMGAFCATLCRLYAPGCTLPMGAFCATLCRLYALRRLCAGCTLSLGVGSRAPSAPAMPAVRHPCPLRVALGLYWWRDVEGWRRICTEKESRVTEGQGMRIAL